MTTKRVKYLAYIEETKKQHKIIKRFAKVSASKAVTRIKNKNVALVYKDGDKIVKYKNGTISTIRVLKSKSRTVKKGTSVKLSKRK